MTNYEWEECCLQYSLTSGEDQKHNSSCLDAAINLLLFIHWMLIVSSPDKTSHAASSSSHHPAPLLGELLSRQITSLDKDSKQNNFWLHMDMFTPINTHTQTAWLPSTETLLLVLSFLQKFTWTHYLISSARKNFGAKLLGQNDHLIVLSNKTQKKPPAHCHC